MTTHDARKGTCVKTVSLVCVTHHFQQCMPVILLRMKIINQYKSLGAVWIAFLAPYERHMTVTVISNVMMCTRGRHVRLPVFEGAEKNWYLNCVLLHTCRNHFGIILLYFGYFWEKLNTHSTCLTVVGLKLTMDTPDSLQCVRGVYFGPAQKTSNVNVSLKLHKSNFFSFALGRRAT